MTNIERFQRLQVELVRAGFATDLQAKPNGDKAVLTMHVELRAHEASDIERLDTLAGGLGFSYTIGEQSRAAITLAPSDR